MLLVFEKLMDGDGDIVEQFVAAEKFWRSFVKKHGSKSEEELGDRLGCTQSDIEEIFGGDRRLAKACMALTCIGVLYDEIDGWPDGGKRGTKVRGRLQSKQRGKFSIPPVARVYALDLD